MIRLTHVEHPAAWHMRFSCDTEKDFDRLKRAIMSVHRSGRWWNPSEKCWVITGIGLSEFKEASFGLPWADGHFAKIQDLALPAKGAENESS